MGSDHSTPSLHTGQASCLNLRGPHGGSSDRHRTPTALCRCSEALLLGPVPATSWRPKPRAGTGPVEPMPHVSLNSLPSSCAVVAVVLLLMFRIHAFRKGSLLNSPAQAFPLHVMASFTEWIGLALGSPLFRLLSTPPPPALTSFLSTRCQK